jgi:VWFA-related protein
MRRFVLPALLLPTLATAPALVPGAFPQTGPDPPVFSTVVDMVKITVTVLDGSGKPVTGLDPSDFTILEDGRPQSIELFARSYEPGEDETLEVDLGLLMDTSESMIDVLGETRMAATRFLEAVPRASELLTVFFDHDIRLSRYDSEHQQGLIRRIQEAEGGGNTALYDAITVYLSRVYGSGGRQVMVLFSDGEDSVSEVSMGETLEMVRASNVTIYPIAFSANVSQFKRAFTSMAFLRQLAEVTGGEIFMPMGTRTLPEIYTRIIEQLEAQYVIGFVSDGALDESGFRKLEVRLSRGELEVRHRKGYYPLVPPGAVAPSD